MSLRICAVAAALVLCAQGASAAFVEDFMAPQLARDPAAHRGWAALSGGGDNQTSIAFTQKNGVGIITVDATRNRRNIWWALIKRSVTPYIDDAMLGRPDKALRIETRIRLLKPRRINLSFVHTRTTDPHRDMMEYDITDTKWHVISFTDRHLDATPKDEVFAQLALYDSGRETLCAELAYFKVRVVDAAGAPPDRGNPQPYMPPVKPPERFAQALPAAQDAMIDSAWPDTNFASWSDGGAPLLSVSGTQMILLRWDFSAFAGKTPKGWGLLALTAERVARTRSDRERFGTVRVVEITGGDPDWTRATVTRTRFLAGRSASTVLNHQRIADAVPEAGGRMLVKLSPAVLARLMSGRTKGLALYAEGAVTAAFASGRSADPKARPTLYFDAR